MRSMSFALTSPQILARTKTVTRRVGRVFLCPGDRIRAVQKAQGLKKGERQHPLAILEVTDVRRERIDRLITEPGYGHAEVALEGFADDPTKSDPAAFVAFFCETHGCHPWHLVTRIAFRYVEALPVPAGACLPLSGSGVYVATEAAGDEASELLSGLRDCLTFTGGVFRGEITVDLSTGARVTVRQAASAETIVRVLEVLQERLAGQRTTIHELDRLLNAQATAQLSTPAAEGEVAHA